MLIGRSGTFTLKPPFTNYASNGLNGKIVELSYIQHMVPRGRNAKNLVYAPVDALDLYDNDYKANVLIVSIRSSNGTIYMIPDAYIENLYNDDLYYVNSFLTVNIGDMPISYNYARVKEVIANSVRETIGVGISANDVHVSATTHGTYLSKEDADELIDSMEAIKSDWDSDYAKLQKLEYENTTLYKKLDTMEKTLFDII